MEIRTPDHRKRKHACVGFSCGYQINYALCNFNAHWKAKNHKSDTTIEDNKVSCQVGIGKHRHDNRKQKS